MEVREQEQPPRTMWELYSRIWELGDQWRKKNSYIVNEGKKNERVEIPRPSVAIVAKALQEICHFTFIGEGVISDISKLYLYHLDLGHYVSSNDIFRKLLLKYDSRLTSNKFFLELISYIRTETKMKPPLDDYRYIPVANGVYNIKTHKLEEFSPNFVITSKIQTEY
ncbi:DNA primase, partial [Streptococcus pneumoniae]|nr:DNA primase [Streptococcus pneumoniae]